MSDWPMMIKVWVAGLSGTCFITANINVKVGKLCTCGLSVHFGLMTQVESSSWTLGTWRQHEWKVLEALGRSTGIELCGDTVSVVCCPLGQEWTINHICLIGQLWDFHRRNAGFQESYSRTWRQSHFPLSPLDSDVSDQCWIQQEGYYSPGESLEADTEDI